LQADWGCPLPSPRRCRAASGSVVPSTQLRCMDMQRVQGAPPSQRALACRHASHPSTHCSVVRPFFLQCPHGLYRAGEREIDVSMRMRYLPRVVASGLVVPTAVQIVVSGSLGPPAFDVVFTCSSHKPVQRSQHRLRRLDADLPLTFTARFTKPRGVGPSVSPEDEA
jgi:hypothetical protein